jgi:GntR family transcriptional regulator
LRRVERRPLYARLVDELRASIRDGRHPPGTALPSESELALLHGVSRGTVRHAIAVLAAEGAVASRQGARSIVLSQPRTQSFGELLSFSAWARALGEEPRGRMVELRRRRADPDEAERLGVAAGDDIYALVRVRLLGERPVMIERTLFVEGVGRMLGSLRLEVDSIYERLGEQGVVFAHARHVIEALAADERDAALLEVPVGTPLLRQERRTTSPDGSPLELSDDRYLGSAVSFVIANSAARTSLERLRGAGDEEE